MILRRQTSSREWLPLAPGLRFLELKAKGLRVARRVVSSGRRYDLGILTLHDGSNEGGILQALMTSRLLEGVVIDHRYPRRNRFYRPTTRHETSILADAEVRLPLTRRFLSDEIDETCQYVNESFRGVVLGSDELWKFGMGLCNPLLPPLPSLYHGMGITVPKFTLASSIGDSDWNVLPDVIAKRLSTLLAECKVVTFRDDRTHAFLKWLSPSLGNRASRAPDPVFAFRNEERVMTSTRAKLKAQGIGARPWALITDWSSEIAAYAAAHLAGHQLVSFGAIKKAPLIDVGSGDFSVVEWAAAVAEADFCVTKRMHPLNLRLMANKPCLTFDPRPKTAEIKDRFDLTEIDATMAPELIREKWPNETIRIRTSREKDLLLEAVRELRNQNR